MIKNIFIKKILLLLIAVVLTNNAFSEVTFKDLESKKTSYLEFFLLKFENRLLSRSLILKKQIFATRVQYSNVGIQVDYDNKNNKIFVKINAIMDRVRYTKKKYKPKLSDCNQVRNLILYQKHGYKFLTQKRDPNLSLGIMEDIFKDVFFYNISFNEKEIDFVLKKMFVTVTIFNPIKKTKLTCQGKINDYELN